MASRSYRIGQRFEYRVRDYLTDLGWLVIRSPRSAGPFDLIAVGCGGTILLVQCKVDGVLPPIEWNALHEVAWNFQVLPIVVFRERRKLQWRQLLGPKDGLHKPQPWVHIHVHAAKNPERVVRAA